MSVDGVNNSNNAGLYAASGAVLGAGAGVATGYLTKPFLKDGVPKDSFVKALGDNLVDAPDVVSAEQKRVFTEVSPILEKLSNANNAEELNKVMAGLVDQMANGKTLEEFQEYATNGFGLSIDIGTGNGASADAIEAVNNAKSIEEAKDIMKNAYKEELGSKGFEKVKAEFRASIDQLREMGVPLSSKDFAKDIWKEAYDSANKKFVKDAVTDETMAVIKKTIRSFQGKAAMMYGAIGAAVLGVTGFLCGSIGANKDTPETSATPETPQKVDTQAQK